MKKFFLLLLALGIGLPLGAKQIDETSALATARKFCRKDARLKSVKEASDLVLSYTSQRDGNKLFYVFNSKSGNGYVIVSADDCTREVLGYSENGTFDINNINDNLRYWLSTYEGEIENAIVNDIDGSMTEAEVQRANQNRKPVYPLVSARWNQDSPYNDQCPQWSSSYGNCASGCVATAMAQVMYYHKWPETGNGSHSYSCTINGSAKTLSMNFANVSFDWDNMTDTYNSRSTDAQRRAVATLMSACGISLDMQYGQSSGTQSGRVVDALIQYFDYDRSIRHYTRENYNIDQWEDLIYTDLAAGRPVVYHGQSSGGGHCFVCDGYSQDNYFHFNWGWGGMSDGYFLLTALNPGSQGIGGSSTADGFNTSQGVICGIRKQAGTKAVYGMIYGLGDFKCTTTSVSTTSTGNVAFNLGTTSYAFQSDSHYDAQVALLFAITNDATGATKYFDFRSLSDNPADYSYNSYGSAYLYGQGYLRIPVSYLSALSAGTYTITPMYKVKGEDEYKPFGMPVGALSTVKMTVSSSNLTFTNGVSASAALRVASIDYANIYAGKPFMVTADLRSENAEYLDDVYLTISSGSGRFATLVYQSEKIRVAVPKDGTRTLKIYVDKATLGAGTYTLKLLNAKDQVVYTASVTVTAAPTEDFAWTVTDCSFGDNNAVNAGNMVLTSTINCTQGFFGGKLRAIVYDESETRSFGELSQRNFVIEKGKTVTETNIGSLDLESNTTYTLVLFGTPSDDTATKRLYSMKFRVADPSGINSVVSDEVQHTGLVTVYDIQGRVLYKADAEVFDINDVDAKGVLIVRSQAGVTKMVK